MCIYVHSRTHDETTTKEREGGRERRKRATVPSDPKSPKISKEHDEMFSPPTSHCLRTKDRAHPDVRPSFLLSLPPLLFLARSQFRATSSESIKPRARIFLSLHRAISGRPVYGLGESWFKVSRGGASVAPRGESRLLSPFSMETVRVVASLWGNLHA